MNYPKQSSTVYGQNVVLVMEGSVINDEFSSGDPEVSESDKQLESLLVSLKQIDSIETSQLSFHSAKCCGATYRRLQERLLSAPNIGQALAAIPALIKWTPTHWPLYWCQLVRSEMSGDCGVHAHLASLTLDGFSIPHERGRIAVSTTSAKLEHWNKLWTQRGASTAWLAGNYRHHEVLKIGSRWWDPTEAVWFSGVGSRLEAGFVAATRVDGSEWQLVEIQSLMRRILP